MSQTLSYEEMDAMLDAMAAEGKDTRSLGTAALNAIAYPTSDYTKRQSSILGRTVEELQAGKITKSPSYTPAIAAASIDPIAVLDILAGETTMSQTLDDFRDILDRLLPEEALGLELGGSTTSGQRMYNGVWIEDGKVKYQYPNGSVRTLGYTPKAAKKKFKRKSRRKRWTTRDQKEMEWRAHIAAIAAGQASVAPI